jgi:hypothetical protein
VKCRKHSFGLHDKTLDVSDKFLDRSGARRVGEPHTTDEIHPQPSIISFPARTAQYRLAYLQFSENETFQPPKVDFKIEVEVSAEMKVIWLRKDMEEQQQEGSAGEQQLFPEGAIEKIKEEINAIEPYYRRTLDGGFAIRSLGQLIGQIEGMVSLGQRDEQLKRLIVSLGREISNLFYEPLPLSEEERQEVRRSLKEIDDAFSILMRWAGVSVFQIWPSKK